MAVKSKFRLRTIEATEAQIQGSIIDYLESLGAVNMTQVKGRKDAEYAALWRQAADGRGPVAYFYRNNVGWGRPGLTGERMIAYGAVGSSDIVGCMRNGTQLRIEVKKRLKRVTGAQEEYRYACDQLGYLHVVASCVDDVEEAISMPWVLGSLNIRT